MAIDMLDPAIDRWRWGPCIAIAIGLYGHSDGDRYRFSIDRCGTLVWIYWEV